MRSLHVSFVALSLVAFMATACSNNNDDPRPNNIVDNNGANNGSNNGATNGSNNGVNNGANNGGMDVGSPDMGVDLAVDSPGTLNGTWRVERSADMSSIATLRLRHAEGMTSVTGTFTMEEGTGPIAGATFVNEEFSCSWTLDIEDSNEQFGLGDCARDDADTFSCRYTSTVAGAAIDATMKRQP